MPGWHISSGGGGGGAGGDVVGPSSSTDNALVRFDSTTGKLIQDGVLTSADLNGDVTGPTSANDTSAVGAEFTNQPANDGVTIVSDDAGDTTQTVTIIGTTNGSDTVVTEDMALNGVTPVNSVKVDWGVILAVSIDAACAGTMTVSETSGGLTVVAIATPNTSAGIDTTALTAWNRAINIAADDATTKQVGIRGTNSAGATIYDSQALSGTTSVASNSSFATVTGFLLGDLEAARTVTFTTLGGTKIDGKFVIGGSTGATDNAILAADGTGGSTAQARDLTISDESGGVVTLATTAGNALTIETTEPAATTGASVVGSDLTVIAGDAVASTDTAGAAAGGAVIITAGDAARLTSGNATGGAIKLYTGSGVGTGIRGGVHLFGDTSTDVHVYRAEDLLAGSSGAAFLNGTDSGYTPLWVGGIRMDPRRVSLSADGLFLTRSASYIQSTSTTHAATTPTSSESLIYSTGPASWTFANGTATAPASIVVSRSIEASTAGSGAPNVLTALESNKVLTNEGSTAANYHTLPTAVAGYVYTFVVQDADGLRITANTGDTIQVIDKVTAAAGYIESTTIGSCVTLISINATEWYAVSIKGVFTDGTFTYDDTSLTSP